MLIRIILQIRAVEDSPCTEDADDCRSVVVDLNCVDEFPIFASVVSLLSFRPMESLPIHRYIYDTARSRLCGLSSPHTYSGHCMWIPHLSMEVEQAHGFAPCAFGNILLNITLLRKPLAFYGISR